MDNVQLVAIAASLLLLVVVVDLVRRRLLAEEYSFAWILLSVAMVVMSTWRGALHLVAAWLDVHYPPAVLLLLLAFFGFVGALFFSVIVSRQRAQLARLVEQQAILAARIRDLEAAAATDTTAPHAAAAGDEPAAPRRGAAPGPGQGPSP